MKPNAICNICEKPIYRKPAQINRNRGNVFCSKKCFWKYKGLIENKQCETCHKIFKPEKRTSCFCSRACSNISRRGISYSKESEGNKSQRRLAILKNNFNFDHCMIENCNYNKTYDVHRLIEGKNGGKYEIGNMFAICPNHHAEVHRKIIIFEKINDWSLKAIDL
jgi:endogenous inhibitor of DNA gyrase (YacG/DUF329 family)